MRAPVRKQLIATFGEDLERRFPQFSLLKERTGSLKIWKYCFVSKIWFFVALQPFENEDIFVLEVAWSEDGEFPLEDGLSSTFAVESSAWRNRLSDLWRIGNPEPVWDAAPEATAAMEAALDALRRGESLDDPDPPAVKVVLPRIAPLVDDALQKLREYGIPVFNRVAMHRGLGRAFEV